MNIEVDGKDHDKEESKWKVVKERLEEIEGRGKDQDIYRPARLGTDLQYVDTSTHACICMVFSVKRRKI